MAEAERKWSCDVPERVVPVCLDEQAGLRLALSFPAHPLPDLFRAGGGRHQLLHHPSPTLDTDTLRRSTC